MIVSESDQLLKFQVDSKGVLFNERRETVTAHKIEPPSGDKISFSPDLVTIVIPTV